MITATIQEIVLAGLLHDIGKFAQRAGMSEYKDKSMEGILCRSTKQGYYTHQHVLYTLGYLDTVKDCFPDSINVGRLINLAAYHHNPSEEDHHIITIADRLSSGMDRFSDKELEYEAQGQFYEQPMLNIASTLSIKETENSAPLKTDASYLPIRPLDGNAIGTQGQKKISKNEYLQQWSQFEKDFLKLKGLGYDEFLAALLTILERYTWCIPSSTIDDPDISLFHHAKTTAAFAACIAVYAAKHGNWINTIQKDAPYTFVQGDMSGIQKFIFNLPTSKYNAKILRARSFQIWSLSFAFAKFATHTFGMTDANIITFAGGRFMLLVPRTDKTSQHVKNLQFLLDEYMLKGYSGQLACILSQTDINDSSELTKARGLELQFRMQNQEIQSKKKKFQLGLHKTWYMLDEEYEKLQKNGDCPLCQINPKESNSEHCKGCSSLISIGGTLMQAKRIVIDAKELLPFEEMVKVVRKSSASTVFGYTNREYIPGLPMITLPYLAPYRDDEETGLLSFEEIAMNSKTKKQKKLAMFKADIDNLGLLFSSSLGNRWSLSRYSDLSYQFQQFFSSFLAQMIQGNEKYKKSIYVVFSGGDDLCVIGPWDVVMEFALDFRQRLDVFTNHNKAITLSGGIALASSSLPVKNLAAMAENGLETSKQRKERNLIVKDGITIFGVTQSWEAFQRSLSNGKQMLKYIDANVVSKATVYRIIDFSHRAERVGNGELKDLLWASNYQYQLSRTIDKNQREVRSWFEQFGASPSQMVEARVSASYALYQVRDRSD
ncbi:MAG: type III-A CRISPR-associated protein Cas10/Csm1 [Sphaerochaeta sp.]|uniref:type III-A CRISPR-associated protein Cas10/Csm1 n=1 Tax=Sphaerochaeta sp. TaxID=1972642 RepID=UPI003D147200